MHIIYVASFCSDAVYQQLFSGLQAMPAFQAQKYHRLFAEGLAANCAVDAVANAPVHPSIMTQDKVVLPDDSQAGVCYHNINAYRKPLHKLIAVFCGSFWKTLKLIHRDSAVVVDCLSPTCGAAALLAAGIRRVKTVCVVTDLPDLSHGRKIDKLLRNSIIRFSDSYVVLTKAMNDYINHTGKPYVVLEGHSDIAMKEKQPSLQRKHPKRVCMYAGSVSGEYGLPELVQGFQMANLPDTELHIYGNGDYVETLKQIAQDDSRVKYGGMLFSGEVVEREMEATLLVNPRPTKEEFVKYSFPSKTMEYMSTGTPVLTTVLPGMPGAYYPHVFLIRNESAEGIAYALTQTLSDSDESLFAKGMAAREFILNERSNAVQASKVLRMLEQEL